MAGYTRQSVADIVDGEDIIAAPLNNEFNAIQAAMHATTGHTHDASAGNGPKLVLTAAASVSGTLPLANGGTNAVLVDPNADRIMFWDDSAGAVTWLTASTGLAITTTNLTMSFLGLETLTDPNADRILFWDDSAGSFAWLEALSLTTTALVPATNDGLALGTTSLKWADLFLASGAVINFNSDVLLTHSADLLAMTGGMFQSTGPTGDYAIRGLAGDASFGGVIGVAQNGSTYGILGYANSYSLYGNAAGYLFNSLSIESADAGAGTGPQLVLNRTSASPAVSDLIGYIAFSGRDSAANGATYADILSQILDPTNGSEDGQLIIRTMTGGSQEYCATFRGGGIQGTIGNITPGPGTFTTLLSTTLTVNNTGGGPAANINVLADGSVVELAQGGATEGTISISGTTCTYGTFFGSHWSQPLSDDDRKKALRGTIVESVSEMCFWEDETNQHLPKFQISNTPQSKRVYGVFAWWDEDGDAFIGAIGAYMIRIGKGVVVEVGDYIESDGTGCGRVQADDILRSCTVGKVTSTEIIETYEDGSYLVPCTLHCG